MMRISISYLYTIFKFGYPHSVDDALRSFPEIQQLGFRFIEMEGLGRNNLEEVYKRRAEIRRALDDFGLHVHNFCVVDPAMTSLDAKNRNAALERFRLGCEIAATFDTETLHLASYSPPVEYLQTAPYELRGEAYTFENVIHLRLPDGFDWAKVWEVQVISARYCADLAAEYQRVVLMEPRIGEVICSPDSLLRLIEHVDRPNLKANLDTGHFSAQRENVVLSVAKLKGHFANVHVADNDPRNSGHVPIGDGSIDWKGFLLALHQGGYSGYLGLDLGASTSLIADYKRSAERLLELGRELNIPIGM
jgi:sugar phosphate isomerase/epimerase